MQNEIMPNVLIRDLPPETHSVLVRRASAARQSLQAYLTTELERLAGQPTAAEVFAEIEQLAGGRVGFAQAQADLDEARAERNDRF